MKCDPLLRAALFNNDPKIVEAKKLLIEAIAQYQKKPVSILPSHPDLISSYKELLKEFHEIRGGDLYFPYLGSSWGNGVFVELLDGSIKYDMITGIGPHFWGHSYLPLMEVAMNAAIGDTIMQGHLQQTKDALVISSLLTGASSLPHCFLSSSGAMANENALKILFQHQFPANRILAFEKCFMGRTIALSQITDKPSFREGLPQTLEVDYIPFYSHENPKQSTENAVQILHQHLARYPKQHAAMCFELIQGEGGFNSGTTEFFTALCRVLKEHHIPVFIDEIQTFGRTPQLFAFQYFKLEEYVDIVSVGKLSQVCATLFRSHLKPKSGLLSQTFTSSTVALQTSAWILKHLLKGDFYGPEGKLVALHRRFEEHFKRIEKEIPHCIKGPYGIGAMVAFVPFGGEVTRVASFVQKLFQAGVISFVAGSHPTRVRFLIPAGVMTLEDVDAVMKIVENTLRDSL